MALTFKAAAAFRWFGTHYDAGDTVDTTGYDTTDVLRLLRKAPVYVDAGGGGAGAVVVQAFPFAFDTPGLVVPAAGPAGIRVCDVAAGDVVVAQTANGSLGTCASVETEFDGASPTLFLTESGNRGDLPGGGPGSLLSQDLSVADSDPDGNGVFLYPNNIMLGSGRPFFVTAASSLYAYIASGLDGTSDPGSTVGAGTLFVVKCTPA